MSKIEKYFEHLSLSTINLFIRDKSKFCLKASGLEDSMGNPAMLRGRAVENQLLTVPIYKERNIEELINDADVFYQTESLEFDKTIEKEGSFLTNGKDLLDLEIKLPLLILIVVLMG